MRAALRRLDARLADALAAFDAAHAGPVTDRLRGLVITAEQCQTALRQEPARPVIAWQQSALPPLWPDDEGSWAERLGERFELTPFDLDVLLLALASEFDLRYERLLAYLQDDVTRKRPTVDLALSLLCADDDARFAARGRFAADAPLQRHRLIHLVADPNALHPPLLAQFIGADEHLLRALLGAGGLHSELARCCVRENSPPINENVLPGAVQAELERAVASVRACRLPAPLWLHGAGANGTLDLARALAHASGTPLLRLDATRVPAHEAEAMLRQALREAWMGGDWLCVEHADAWLGDAPLAARLAALLRDPMCALLLGAARALPTELLGVARPLAWPLPDARERQRCWVAALARHGVVVPAGDSSALAARFRLAPSQIDAAAADAALRSHGNPPMSALAAAARAQSGDALASVADKVHARATWDDIVLPADAAAQLRDLCSRVEQHERVFVDWGFGAKLARGRGTAALFSGGSGTGKTMAAEVIANQLGLDLYRIDLARVVNKYIGETEKNLDRVFAAAESANAILFFDEADALFGKRSEVKDAHDRYANIEVSYLLQKMEEYEGVAILASNLADHLDAAFTRRLAFHIYFPFPDEAARLSLWHKAWPHEVPLSAQLDFVALARDLKLSGGSIANIALATAFGAASNGGVVDVAHVQRAALREAQKTGQAPRKPAATMGMGDRPASPKP
jgi:AAA+ superfamily predicted ATPase